MIKLRRFRTFSSHDLKIARKKYRPKNNRAAKLQSLTGKIYFHDDTSTLALTSC